jgi:hypothetical protein
MKVSRNLGFWRLFEAMASLLAVASIVGWYGLWMHYADTRPRNIDVGSGRIIVLYTHGLTVYLNAEEQHRLRILNYMTGVFLLSAVIVDVLKKPFRRPNEGA